MSHRGVTVRPPNARDIGAAVLERVEKTGAFASAVLDAEIDRAAQLDPRDRAFATELVYGSLRVLGWLSDEVGRFVPRGLDAVDPRTRAHLIVAAYQIFFMRTPAFAAVSEAVDAVRAQRGDKVAAFANAVLRRVAERAGSWDDSRRQETIVDCAPAWLRDALGRALTPAGGRLFLQCGIEAPAVGLRVERVEDRDAWVARLRAALPEGTFRPGRVSPLAILARGAGKPQKLPGWGEGALSVQEEGSQLGALAVGAREGDVVLDACAGRGNKTAVLARAVGARGAVDACDASATKLSRLGSELTRLGLHARATYAVDWSVGSGEVAGSYDRVLVDAPCSGVGTLRRRPEIVLRRELPDLAAMARVQRAIAARAAGHLRPGGSLVYVVCSVLQEEGEEVVRALMHDCPELEPAEFDSPAVTSTFGAVSSFRLLPHVHGTDGYFLARFVKRLSASETTLP